MAHRSFGQNCSIARALEVVGERWTVLVLREVFLGNHRFDQMQQRLGIARNILAERLQTLVGHGVLERRIYRERPARFEYRLTEKGRELYPVLAALMRWGDRYAAEAGPPVVMRHTPCGHDASPTLVCGHCGEELRAEELLAEPGPGLSPGDVESNDAPLAMRGEQA